MPQPSTRISVVSGKVHTVSEWMFSVFQLNGYRPVSQQSAVVSNDQGTHQLDELPGNVNGILSPDPGCDTHI